MAGRSPAVPQAGMAECEALLKDLRAAEPAKAEAVLAKLKVAMLPFALLPPFHEDPAVAKKQLLVAREALELGSLAAVKLGDMKAFGRHVSQLKVYYFEYAPLLPESPNQWLLLGLNLMALLADNKLSEFHTELELLPLAAYDMSLVKFPILLEQELMEGSYGPILKQARQLPSPEYSRFMAKLTDTTRDRIAACSERAYSSLRLQDVAVLLSLPNEAEARIFAQGRDWTVSPAGVVTFPSDLGRKAEVQAVPVIRQALGYATELERIV